MKCNFIHIIIIFLVSHISTIEAASTVELESWCNSVNAYWTNHEDYQVVGSLPDCSFSVCRSDLYETWIRECELSIISNAAERCRSKLLALVQDKYGPPREQQITRVMCHDDCVTYQYIMEEALSRTCCTHNCTHAHPLQTDKACYENMLEMSGELLGISKTRLEWVLQCSSAIRLATVNLLFTCLIGIMITISLVI